MTDRPHRRARDRDRARGLVSLRQAIIALSASWDALMDAAELADSADERARLLAIAERIEPCDLAARRAWPR